MIRIPAPPSPTTGRTHGGFAQGALVAGGGGIVDCAAAVGLSSVASSDAIPLFAAVDLVGFEGGKFLFAHGATVPDSGADGGVPLRADATSVWAGSIIDVGPRAHGALVPTVGVGVGGVLLLRGAVVLVVLPERLVAATVLPDRLLAAWSAHGA